VSEKPDPETLVGDFEFRLEDPRRRERRERAEANNRTTLYYIVI
jgi:hypothetical protein